MRRRLQQELDVSDSRFLLLSSRAHTDALTAAVVWRVSVGITMMSGSVGLACQPRDAVRIRIDAARSVQLSSCSRRRSRVVVAVAVAAAAA